MKIAARAVESFLNKPSAKAVLFYGPDAGLAREYASRLREQFLGKHHDPFALVELEEAALLADPARLGDELLAISMMAPKRLILVRDGGDKLTTIIREARPHFHDDAFLVVVSDDLGKKSSLRLWFEEDASAAALPCYRDEAYGVENIVRKKLAEAGIAVDAETVDFLAGQLGNDRYVTYQELDKIIAFASKDKRLELENARALVDYNRDTSSDDIIFAVADRNLKQLDLMLQVQLREGTTPVAYLRALQRYFNRLYFIRAQMASGKGLDEVISRLKPKVFYKHEPALRRHVQSWGLDQIVRALGLLVSAELACKTSDLPVVAASSRRLMQITQLR